MSSKVLPVLAVILVLAVIVTMPPPKKEMCQCGR
jgi:hypothetical protein